MLKTSKLPSTSITQFKVQHCYNQKLVSTLFREVEGPQAWFALTQGPNGPCRALFCTRLQAYHRDVILACPERTQLYVTRHDIVVANYGASLLN